MKRTLLSSLLFLYPINVAFGQNDRLMMNLNTAGLAISLTNHAHSYHPDDFRRSLFGLIDQKFMMVFSALVSYRCVKKSPTFECFLRVGGNTVLLFLIYFYLLEGYKQKHRAVESYTESQKYIHMLMHFVGIVGLTRAYQTYYYKLD
jgi:hypothetical protein